MSMFERYTTQHPAGCVQACRGCSHRGWDVLKSEEQKYKWVYSQLSKFTKSIEPVVGVQGEGRWGYRQKTCLHTFWNGKKWEFGLLGARKNKREKPDLIPIPDCPVHSQWICESIHYLSENLPSPNDDFPLVYLCFSGRLITLVLKTHPKDKRISLNWERLGAHGVWLNFNPSAGHRVFSSRGWRNIWGSSWDREDSEGFQYGPDSFQQLIPELHAQALHEAQRFLRPSSQDVVIDLCSGIGRSLKVWQESGASLLGVELNGEAVECSRVNLGVQVCLRGKAGDRIPQLDELVRKQEYKNRLVYANPPRTGLEEKVIHWIGQDLKPVRLAYLSCSAGTLSRDLTSLASYGYTVKKVIPYDFFPQTHHIETLALIAYG